MTFFTWLGLFEQRNLPIPVDLLLSGVIRGKHQPNVPAFYQSDRLPYTSHLLRAKSLWGSQFSSLLRTLALMKWSEHSPKKAMICSINDPRCATVIYDSQVLRRTGEKVE